MRWDARARLVAFSFALAPQVLAMPRLMDLYNEHPRALAQNRDKCTVCHVNGDGSGSRTAFGEKYEQAGLEFTSALADAYPNLFAPAKTGKTSAVPSKLATVAPPQGVAVEWSPARFYREECTKCHGKYADGDPTQGVPAFAAPKWIKERMPQGTLLLEIIMKGKDKMVGMEGKISEEQGRRLLEYVKAIAVQYGS